MNPIDERMGENLLRVLTACAKGAGDIIRERFHGDRQVQKKGAVDLVTDVDRAAEAHIAQALVPAYPGAQLMLEEGGTVQAPGAGYEDLTLIVDPLDGTTNYAARIPHVGVSIAVMHRSVGLCAAVIYDPFRDELFWARRGAGSFLNQVPISVSDHVSLIDCVVATGFPYDRAEKRDNNHVEHEALNCLTRGARRFGAATLDLAWVAAGRFDAYWERGLKPWDAAAGILLVEEAGGCVTHYDGSAVDVMRGEVLATNAHVHRAMQHALLEARRSAGF